MVDDRIAKLNPWQREVYKLAWTCGALKDRKAGSELDKRKRARPAVQLAVDLIRRRDDMRLILGSRYEAEIRPLRKHLRELARTNMHIPLIKIALQVGQTLSDAGHDPSYWFAAFVDEAEARRG